MNIIDANHLAPVSPASPPLRRSLCRSRPSFQLPSFEALGIASALPDHPGGFGMAGDSDSSGDMDSMDGTAAEASMNRQPGDCSLLMPDFGRIRVPSINSDQQAHQLDMLPSKGHALSSPLFPKDAAMLTPPADVADLHWPLFVVGPNAPMDTPSTDPGRSLSSATSTWRSPGDAGSSPAPSVPAPGLATPTSRIWITDALDVLLDTISRAPVPRDSLRVLSHALPSPSQTGHVFPLVIEALHQSPPSRQTVWINVFHAIQGRFNLADLPPTSPPATPGPPIGGDDYFTQKVFDSAVPISDYQEDLSGLPRSPRPVVPPSSIHVSIVERYIPPSTAHEFRDMFNVNGPSLLLDRLVELSPNNGSLIFVYPTKTGATTFMHDYLGPILDPQLRSLVVVNGLSTGLSSALGKMVAVEYLPEYEQMHRSVAMLCGKLTQHSSSMQRFHGRRAAFALTHASRQEVRLDRETWWKGWWAKQEKQRIREAMTRYTQDAAKKSSNESSERSPTPTELIQQLFDEVGRKPYPSGHEPTSRIEVSVFVIRRSD